VNSVLIADESAMFSGDVAKGNPQIAIFPPADDGYIPADGKTSSLSISPEHHQYNLH
jgi:hypothetical protein